MGTVGWISSGSFGKEGGTEQRQRIIKVFKSQEAVKGKGGGWKFRAVEGGKKQAREVRECQMWLRPEITLLFLSRCVLGYRKWSRVNSALLLSSVLSEIGLGKKQRQKHHMDLIIRKGGHLKVRHGQLEECWWPRWCTVSRDSPWRCMDQINQAKKKTDWKSCSDVLDVTCLTDSSTIQENFKTCVISSIFCNRGCWKEQSPIMC